MIRFGEKRKEAIIIIIERKKNQNINRSIFSSRTAGKFKRKNFPNSGRYYHMYNWTWMEIA